MDPELPLPPPRHEDAGKLTLVLDINETLVHVCIPMLWLVLPFSMTAITSSLPFAGHRRRDTRCGDRGPNPYQISSPCSAILTRSQQKVIAVWGSGHPIYVHGVADELDRERRYIRWRISGFALSEDKTKDLADIGRDLRRTVMIDNNPKYMEKNFDNGIVCKEFVGQKDDSELLRLSTFLLEQVDSSVTDIRSIVKTWQN